MHDVIRTLNEIHILPILLVSGVVLLVVDYLFETDIPCQVGYFCFAAALFFALPQSVAVSLALSAGLWILLVVLHFAWFRKFLN